MQGIVASIAITFLVKVSSNGVSLANSKCHGNFREKILFNIYALITFPKDHYKV